MSFFGKLFGVRPSQLPQTPPDQTRRNENVHQRTDPQYIQAIAEIPTGWKQYEESLRLIKSTVHCDTYFDRKEFMIARLGTVKRLIDYVGGSNTFIDLMTNTDITVSSSDIDTLVADLNTNNYDEQFIKRYSNSLLNKVTSLKTTKAKLNNIDKWQQWLAPYNDQLSPELCIYFYNYCASLKKQVNETS